MWRGPRSTSVPSGILIHPAVWPQSTWAEKWGLCPFLRGAGFPSNTMSSGSRPTSVPSDILIHPAVWPQQTWAEYWGLYSPFAGGTGSHLSQCCLGRGLPPYQVTSRYATACTKTATELYRLRTFSPHSWVSHRSRRSWPGIPDTLNLPGYAHACDRFNDWSTDLLTCFCCVLLLMYVKVFQYGGHQASALKSISVETSTPSTSSIRPFMRLKVSLAANVDFLFNFLLTWNSQNITLLVHVVSKSVVRSSQPAYLSKRKRFGVLYYWGKSKLISIPEKNILE